MRSDNVKEVLPDEINSVEKYWWWFRFCRLSFFHSLVLKGDRVESLIDIPKKSKMTQGLK